MEGVGAGVVFKGQVVHVTPSMLQTQQRVKPEAVQVLGGLLVVVVAVWEAVLVNLRVVEAEVEAVEMLVIRANPEIPDLLETLAPHQLLIAYQ